MFVHTQEQLIAATRLRYLLTGLLSERSIDTVIAPMQVKRPIARTPVSILHITQMEKTLIIFLKNFTKKERK